MEKSIHCKVEYLEIQVHRLTAELNRVRGAMLAVFEVCKGLRIALNEQTEDTIDTLHEQTAVALLYSNYVDDITEGHEDARHMLG